MVIVKPRILTFFIEKCLNIYNFIVIRTCKKVLYAKSIDFKELPYLCQKRFAEICDDRTLKTFAEINHLTKSLANSRHTVSKVEIICVHLDDQPALAFFTILCYSNTDHNLCEEQDDFEDLINRNPYIEAVKIICTSIIPKTSRYFFKPLPLAFASIKHLELQMKIFSFNTLSKVFELKLKSFKFYGEIFKTVEWMEVKVFLCRVINIIKYECNLSFDAWSPYNMKKNLDLQFDYLICFNHIDNYDVSRNGNQIKLNFKMWNKYVATYKRNKWSKFSRFTKKFGANMNVILWSLIYKRFIFW